MGWKDTVNDILKQARLGDPYLSADRERYIAEKCYKAGIEYGNMESYESGVYNGHAEGLAEGIKLVVDWIEQEAPAPNTILYIDKAEWQAKLKEWGL